MFLELFHDREEDDQAGLHVEDAGAVALGRRRPGGMASVRACPSGQTVSKWPSTRAGALLGRVRRIGRSSGRRPGRWG